MVADEKRSSSQTSLCQGLTPVEDSKLVDNGVDDRKARTSQSSASVVSIDKVPVLVSQDKVSAKMEPINEANMVEVDLGDGAGAGPAGNVSGKRTSARDQQNGSTADNWEGHLKPADAQTSKKDEPDGASIYSYYMESDFRYYFQHPYFRLFLAYFVTFCNFLIYAEDPVAHSRKESNIPVIGNCFAFVGTRYPPNAWSFLKVVLWISGTICGLFVGKLLFHTLLFNKLFRLKMFSNDKGSWMTMFLATILCVFIFSYIYNLFLLIGGDSTTDYRISPYMSIGNNIFMKAAATGTWCGDFFTAWMVTDMMLQENLYPMWAKRVKKWWKTRYNRIILFWIVVFVSSFIVIFIIATDYINWDSLNRDFLHTNELSRAFLASFILVMDIMIVMQDWDFPHFTSALDIKLPGVNTAHIHFKIPRMLRKLEYWHIHITGKWFNYGILFIVILLDLNMWKNQIFYAPFDYGQYVDADGRIHSVRDDYSLENFNESLLSFSYRNITVDPITGKRYIELDNVMNARYNDYSLGVKAIAFIPSIGVFLLFGVLVWVYGRLPKPTKDDPYGGRLKKRKHFRLGWKRLRKRIRVNLVVDAFRSAGFEAELRRRREQGSVEETDGPRRDSQAHTAQHETGSMGRDTQTDTQQQSSDSTAIEARVMSKWKQTKKDDGGGRSESPKQQSGASSTTQTKTDNGSESSAKETVASKDGAGHAETSDSEHRRGKLVKKQLSSVSTTV